MARISESEHKLSYKVMVVGLVGSTDRIEDANSPLICCRLYWLHMIDLIGVPDRAELESVN